MVRPKCCRVSARARPARRSSSALLLGAISAENERTVSLFSSGRLSKVGAKATMILSILAAYPQTSMRRHNATADDADNTDNKNSSQIESAGKTQHRKTQSLEIQAQISGRLKSSKRRRDLTADYAEGSDKKSFSYERCRGSTESRSTNRCPLGKIFTGRATLCGAGLGSCALTAACACVSPSGRERRTRGVVLQLVLHVSKRKGKTFGRIVSPSRTNVFAPG